MCASEALRRAAALSCLMLALPALAQQPSREQEQIRRLRQQVQQLQQEQSAQQGEVQRANAEKAELQRKLDALKADLGQQRNRSAEQKRAGEELQAELAKLREEEAARQNELTQLRQALERSTAANDQARAELERRGRLLATREATFADLWARHQAQAEGLQTCIARNDRLAALGNELLQRYEGKGLGELFSQNEPILQFGRVQLENLVQGYRERLDQSAIKPPPPPTSP